MQRTNDTYLPRRRPRQTSSALALLLLLLAWSSKGRGPVAVL